MAKLVYDVAVSLDGYIAGPSNDISSFPATGEHVDAYLERLQGYDTVIMGRRTYEFGYDYGLEPGQRAYPHMRHVVFSSGLQLPDSSDVRIERTMSTWLDVVDELKSEGKTDIYLCGGGQLAGYLLNNDRIDRLVIKLAPAVLGGGVPLFGGLADASHRMTLTSTERHDSGVLTLSYKVDGRG